MVRQGEQRCKRRRFGLNTSLLKRAVFVVSLVMGLHASLAHTQESLESRACITKQLLTHPFKLDEATLERALVLRGLSNPSENSGTTFNTFLQKLLDQPPGSKLNIVMHGSGISAGFGLGSQSSNFLHGFVQVLQGLNPNVTVHGINSAHGSSRPSLGLLCADALMPTHEDVDLVLVEYNTKLGFSHDSFKNNTGYQIYERFIRRMLQWRGNPAVVIVQTSFPMNGWNSTDIVPFYNSSEDAHNVVHQYYNLPVISMRNALYLKQYNNEPGFGLDMRQPDKFHYNELGHTYVTDALAWLVRTSLEIMCIRSQGPRILQHSPSLGVIATAAGCQQGGQQVPCPQLVAYGSNSSSMTTQGEGVSVRLTAALASSPGLRQKTAIKLQAPMLETDSDLDAKYKMCVLAHKLHMFVSDVGDWTYGPINMWHSKWGYQTAKRGSTLQLKLPRPEAEVNETLVLYLSILTSDVKLGGAHVMCVAGCSCTPTFIEGSGHDAGYIMTWAPINLPQFTGETCAVNITYLGGSTASDKFMVSGFALAAKDDLNNAGKPEAFYHHGEHAPS